MLLIGHIYNIYDGDLNRLICDLTLIIYWYRAKRLKEEEEKARRVREEQARLEAERLERETLAAEEARRIAAEKAAAAE